MIPLDHPTTRLLAELEIHKGLLFKSCSSVKLKRLVNFNRLSTELSNLRWYLCKGKS